MPEVAETTGEFIKFGDILGPLIICIAVAFLGFVVLRDTKKMACAIAYAVVSVYLVGPLLLLSVTSLSLWMVLLLGCPVMLLAVVLTLLVGDRLFRLSKSADEETQGAPLSNGFTEGERRDVIEQAEKVARSLGRNGHNQDPRMALAHPGRRLTEYSDDLIRIRASEVLNRELNPFDLDTVRVDMKSEGDWLQVVSAQKPVHSRQYTVKMFRPGNWISYLTGDLMTRVQKNEEEAKARRQAEKLRKYEWVDDKLDNQFASEWQGKIASELE